MNETYNGWKNYQTWNVALYIQNERFYYELARECSTYNEWMEKSRRFRTGATPDGVCYADKRVSRREINAMLKEL